MSDISIKHHQKIRKLIIACIMIILSFILIYIFARTDFNNKNYNTFFSNRAITRDDFYFDTYVSFTIFDSKENYTLNIKSEKDIDILLDTCIEMCENYEKIFSRTRKDSELYILNHSEAFINGEEIPISDSLYECLRDTLQYSEKFGDKYSILSGGLCDLWDYNKKTIPNNQEIEHVLDSIKIYSLFFKDSSITLKKDSDKKVISPIINLGATAKGYITDKICSYLKSKGIREAIIDVGGNIAVIGNKCDNSMYKIGIKKPFSIENEPYAVCKISDKTVVTSGIYERYFEIDNRVYHHIIDCSTGYPVENDILSVTIIADNSLLADCYSTGCLLLGAKDTLDFINSIKEVECVIIDKDYNIILSEGLRYDDNYITLK